MDKSKWLSAEQIIQFSAKKSNRTVLDKFLSLKDDANLIELTEDDRQNYIDNKIDEQFDALNEVRVKTIDNLGILEWLDDKKESIISKSKNIPSFMGRKSNDGKIYLNSEETLFLIESSSVVCYFKSMQLSLQDAYSLMIRSNVEFECYLIYSYLMKFGFRVIKAFGNANQSVENDFMEDNLEKLIDDDTQKCKRRADSLSELDQNLKKPKLSDSAMDLENQINIIPLKQLVNEIHLDDLYEEMNFVKFIRFQKLINGANQRAENWRELIDSYENLKDSQNYKSAIVVEGIEQMNRDFLLNNDVRFNKFKNDFLTDQPIIKLDESLTEEEIQNRLVQHGPQLDLSIENITNDLSVENLSDNLLNNQSDCDTFDTFDYKVYLPDKKNIKSTQADYYFKILHSQELNFPIDAIFRLNSKISDPKKLIFAICQFDDFNFYQFMDVDLVKHL